MNINISNFNQLSLPVKINYKQYSFLIKASKLNKKYFNKSNIPTYYNNIIDDEFYKCLQADIKYFKYNGKIEGFRFEKAPVKWHKKYLLQVKNFPPMIFASLINSNINKISPTPEFNDICSKFNVNPITKISDLKEIKTCSLEDYDTLRNKYPSIDIGFYLTVAGILITDEDSEIKEIMNGHQITVKVKEIIEYHSEISLQIKNIISTIDKVKNCHAVVLMDIQKCAKDERNIDLIKMKQEIDEYYIELRKLKIETILKYINDNNSIHKSIYTDKYLSDEITELNVLAQYVDKIENQKIKMRELDKVAAILNNYGHCLEEIAKDIDKNKTKILEQINGLIKIQNDIDLYKKEMKIDNSVNEEILNKNEIIIKAENEIYPGGLKKLVTEIEDTKNNFVKYIREVFLHEEIKRMENIATDNGIVLEDIEETIDNAMTNNQSITEALKNIYEKIQNGIKNNKTNYDNNKSQLHSYSENELLVLFDLLKQIQEYEVITEEHLKYIFDKISIDDVSSQNEIYLLSLIMKIIVKKYNCNSINTSFINAKYTLIVLLLNRYYPCSEYYEYVMNYHSQLPYHSNQRYKKIIELLLNGKEPVISEATRIGESINKMSGYFEKQNSRYTHMLLKNELYKGIDDILTKKIFPYLETNIYKKILSNSYSKTKLIGIKEYIKNINLELIWVASDCNIKFKNINKAVNDSLSKDLDMILNAALSMIDSIIANYRSDTDMVFYKEEFDHDIQIALNVMHSTLHKSLKKKEEKKDEAFINDIIKEILVLNEFIKKQPVLYAELYSNYYDSIDEMIIQYDIDLNAGKEQEYVNIYLENGVLNRNILQSIRNIVPNDKYRQAKDDYEDRLKKIKSYETKIAHEYKNKYDIAVDSERINLAEELYKQSEKIKAEKNQKEKAQYEVTYGEIKDRLIKIEEWIRNHSDDEIFETVYNVYSEINKILLKADKDKLEYGRQKMVILENYIKDGQYDIAELEMKMNNIHIEQTIDGIPEDIMLIDIAKYMKRIDTIENKCIRERIICLKNNNNIEALLEDYKILKEPSIQVQPSSNIRQYSKDRVREFFNDFAKTFRLYNESNKVALCKYIENPYPFFITNKYISETDSHPVINRKIVMTILNNSKGTFSNSDLQDINGMLKVTLKGPYSPDDYFIICFVLYGKNKGIDEVTKLPDYDNITIINAKLLSSLLMKNASPSKSLHHLLIKHLSIKTLNPYDTSHEVTTQTGVFVGRQDLLTKITKDQISYAIYGARRIGKTSLCLEIQNRFEKNGHIVFYSSVSSRGYKYDTSFNEGLSIAINIYEKLTGVKKVFIDFQEFKVELSKLLEADRSKKYVIILDEFDRFIKETNDYHYNNGTLNKYIFIKVLRDLRTDNPNLKIILSGFIYLYRVLHTELPGVDNAENPWRGFVTSKQLSLLKPEESKELVSKLEEELALQFEHSNLIQYIIENVSDHPAHLQEFCKILVNKISYRITSKNRKIFKKDIDSILSEYTESYDDNSEDIPFIKYVDETTKLNLDDLSKAIIAIFALEDKEEISKEDIYAELKSWGVNISTKNLENAITSLIITDVITENISHIRFRNKFWKNYLHKMFTTDYERFNEIISSVKTIKPIE